MMNGVLKQTRKKTTTRLYSLLHTIWSGRRDHPAGGMTPPADTPSSSGQGARGSSEWSFILEAHAGMAKQLVRYLAIEEALQEEIKHILEHNNKSYGEWCALSDKDKNNNKVKLTVTYAMVWQKRSSGRGYDSSSGHAFIIGARSKGIIRMGL